MTPESASSTHINTLAELAEAVRLREGVEGVSRALWLLYSRDIPSTRAWSQELHIPVPVLAALRRELEKRDVLATGQGLNLTQPGKVWLKEIFGMQEVPRSECPTCKGSGKVLPPEVIPVLEEFRSICEDRPSVDVTLDQSHATPETGIAKAFYLLEQGLLGESLFFMGDDDLISIACHLMRTRFLAGHENPGKICVADIDERYLRMISEISEGSIQTFEYDVRNDFPQEYRDQFSVALTDPAYTPNALMTFAYRCGEALRTDGRMLLSMPIPDTVTLLELQRSLNRMQFVLRDIHEDFNHYIGAAIHAHVSSLFICIKTAVTKNETNESTAVNSFTPSYTPFYTGDIRQPGGMYRCTLCDTIYSVGPDEEMKTIQELKERGCDECENTRFRRISTREIDSSPDDDSSSELLSE